LLYRDVISADEIITDAFDIKEIDDIAYEVDCKMITIKEGADVDIGANASAEEASEELEDGMVQVNNVVYSMRLVETQFDKKSYMVPKFNKDLHQGIHEGSQEAFGSY
jgi:Translationally controlled tumour protein